MQAFLAEAQAILRAHVLAIGGNALVSYQLNELVLLDNPHKHQVSRIQKENQSKGNCIHTANFAAFALCTLKVLENSGALSISFPESSFPSSLPLPELSFSDLWSKETKTLGTRLVHNHHLRMRI